MLNHHLTKLETSLDQLRKSKPNIAATDAALIAAAISLAGRHAIAVFEDEEFLWPKEVDKLSKKLVVNLEYTRKAMEGVTKRASKANADEEKIELRVGLRPNLDAGDSLLGTRNDLKALLSDIIDEGIEFAYSPGYDIGWQWGLDRTNWATVWESVYGGDQDDSDPLAVAEHERNLALVRDLARRILVKCEFEGASAGVEITAGSSKRRTRKSS